MLEIPYFEPFYKSPRINIPPRNFGRMIYEKCVKLIFKKKKVLVQKMSEDVCSSFLLKKKKPTNILSNC